MADALARIREKRAAKIAATLETSRACGDCDLCCTAPGIKELDKPPGEKCVHLSGEPGASCTVYKARPQVCRDFHCLWRMSDLILPKWLHPTRCGFLLAFNNIHVWPGVVTVHVDPARPDSWRSMWAQTVLVTLAERWNCIVAIGQVPICTHLILPDGSCIPTEGADWVMNPDDGTVGAPDFVFGPDKRPLAVKVRETWFDWKLAPPEAEA